MTTTPTMIGTYQSTQLAIYPFNLKNFRGLILPFSLFISSLLVFLSTFGVLSADAASHQVKRLDIPIPTANIPTTLSFPLYEQDSIQYFSAGIGKEERSLTYPPFPLKLIFTQGGRAYLVGVSIDVANQDRTLHIKIPGEEVEGPWLFINIPNGTYFISGTDSNGTTIKKTITMKADQSTVVHYRFP